MTSVLSRMRPEEPTARTKVASNNQARDIALLPIGADLLPQKAIVGRAGRGRRLTAVAIVLVAVVAVAGGYLLALHARSAADDALAAAQDQQTSLQHRQKSFDELVRTQAQAEQLDTALATIMKTDTSWSTVLTGIAKVDVGIDFSSISGSLTDPTTATTSATTTAPTTPGAIGTLTMSGTAADKPRIAAFVDALGSTPGLADPFLSTVNEATGSSTATGYSFSVTVSLTGDLQSAASSRWTTTTGGGK